MSNNISIIREQRGLSQSELARRIGVTPSTVSRIEGGARKLTQDYLMRFARALNCAPGELVDQPTGNLDRAALIPVVGMCARNAWRVPDLAEPTETIPVIPSQDLAQLDHAAYEVVDDHAAELVGEGGYVITVPVTGIRTKPLHGDWLVIRSREGKMERYSVAKARVDQRGAWVTLDGDDVEVNMDNWNVGIVVATYLPLRRG
ncbi:helix-turn-helix domain-containing protein [Maritimibacter sp. DP07]|uniref:Helix-turn-helix domain-containing protein n=1 Tax=Maritimibacter harenae TaxID=2606218 RepID=A0A845M0L5_9RHOB|nr:helix-turn-helix transcriptional regulator [Maritimibacter harenae]MZR12672.1 helix-turn-helix domain-containing protein [Maritimibacter harenae]